RFVVLDADVHALGACDRLGRRRRDLRAERGERHGLVLGAAPARHRRAAREQALHEAGAEQPGADERDVTHARKLPRPMPPRKAAAGIVQTARRSASTWRSNAGRAARRALAALRSSIVSISVA